MTLIVGGHPRSGTTLLRNLCDHHPDITMTFEFGNFLALDRPYKAYRRRILKRWWRTRGKPLLTSSSAHPWANAAESHAFVLRYLFQIHRYRWECIDASTIEASLRTIFPKARVVGDKYPGYVFLLDRLATADGLSRLIIYRDCRDVARSALEQARTNWRGKPFAKKFDTAAKVARRWVRAIELTDRHADRLRTIRYEDLVQQPEREMWALGEWLGVDPAGFPLHIVRDTSIGKHKDELSAEALKTIMEIAGPAMARLGYLS